MAPLESLPLTLVRPDQGDDEFVPRSTLKSLTKLEAEITKLRAIAAFTKAETEEKLLNHQESMDALISDVRSKLEKSQEETNRVRTEIMAKENFIRYVQVRHEEREEELINVEQQNKELAKEVVLVTNTRDDYRGRTEKLEERMATLLTSVDSMVKEQERIEMASKCIEEDMKRDSEQREKTLQFMLEQERSFRKESFESKRVDGGNGQVNDSIEGQHRLLKNIADSLRETTSKNE